MVIISINKLIIDKIGRNKIAHFSVSMNLVFVLEATHSLATGVIFSLLLGIIKEVSDRFEEDNIFSKADMLCNVSGIIAALLLIN